MEIKYASHAGREGWRNLMTNTMKGVKNMVTALTGKNFDDFIAKADKPVLVDLWASWCGPCKMLSPLVDQIAEEYADKLLVGKVNVDEAGDVAMAFNVSSIPTLLLFKDGELVDTSIGYIPKNALVDFVSKAL